MDVWLIRCSKEWLLGEKVKREVPDEVPVAAQKSGSGFYFR